MATFVGFPFPFVDFGANFSNEFIVTNQESLQFSKKIAKTFRKYA
jgi:hypothetical protein